MNKVIVENGKLILEGVGTIDESGKEHCIIKDDDEYTMSGSVIASLLVRLRQVPGIKWIPGKNYYMVVDSKELDDMFKDIQKSIEQNHRMSKAILQFNASRHWYERKLKIED